MTQFSRTWWGRRFIEALEGFTDPSRLGRGRSYANGDRIIGYAIAEGTVTAKVRGSINPYCNRTRGVRSGSCSEAGDE